MEKIKENIINDFIKMIKSSWTFDKMTQNEKNNFLQTLSKPIILDALKGNYNQRWKILNSIYHAYLLGLGHNDFKWREYEETPLF